MTSWFDVDKAGLAKLIEKRGKSFAIFELIQNGWDTSATQVDVGLIPLTGRPLAQLIVIDDDPEGFVDLAHSFTLFAESVKKGDPTKRGRFNLGEKLVLALCEEATVSSTKGSVRFDKDGRTESRAGRTSAGSRFEAVIRMTRAELEEVERAVLTLLPPPGVRTTFNGMLLEGRHEQGSVEAPLPTEIADEEGYLRRSTRTTTVTFHNRRSPTETAMLYEMGIPVVELSGGERWHVNVGQKVPLNVDRDNVTPSYLQTIRVLLANAMRDELTANDAGQVWVNAATEDERIESATVGKVLDERFGKKRAIYDPSDPEASKQLMNEGYTIIPGGSLSGGQWGNVKSAGLAHPAGQLRPSGVNYSPDGEPERIVPPEKWTEGQRRVVSFAIDLGEALIGRQIRVKIVNEMISLPHAAWYGGGLLAFNVGRLGKAWFEQPLGPSHLTLIIHELAHDRVLDHLTHEFADEVGRLGTLAVGYALTPRSLFARHQYRGTP